MSDVDICNLAVSHISDPGRITSIDPPDGSIQAARCATFYPIARTFILQAHDWNFSTTRATLADLSDATGPWLYRYTRPANALRVSKVLAAVAASDEPTEPFITEVDDNGNVTILTNVESATCVYTYDQTDTTRFSPMFIVAFSYLLASYLAGPVIKGKAGGIVAKDMLQLYGVNKSAAATADASEHKTNHASRLPRGIKARL